MKHTIARDEDRMLALGKMVAKLYEDRMMGTLSEDNFQMLMKNTQNEQQELEKRLMDEKISWPARLHRTMIPVNGLI